MPLRDHFRPPVDDHHSWDALFAGWPSVMVQRLRQVLPPGYRSGPRVYLGAADDSCDPREASHDQYEYAVRIYDTARGRQPVCVVALVSPANTDRPESRRAFVSKCSALIEQGVAVSIIDLVTTMHFNLYLDLLGMIGHTDPPPHEYAASCRGLRRERKKPLLQAKSHRLVVGQPLPTLPLWLGVDRVVPLDLEASYEQACYDLSIA